jgi:hypothetical protein
VGAEPVTVAARILHRELLALLTAAERDRASVPAPWAAPAETGDDGEAGPLDHEGCAVWPWYSEADMRLAYWLRNNAAEILAVLAAHSSDDTRLNVPLARVLLERAQDGYVNPTGGKTTGRERKDS